MREYAKNEIKMGKVAAKGNKNANFHTNFNIARIGFQCVILQIINTTNYGHPT